MEVHVNNGASGNQATAQGVVLVDPATGDPITDFGSGVSGGGGTLPPNAAQESGGNLDAISAAAGMPKDAAYSGSGNSTIIGTLKGIFAAVKGSLNIRALTSAQDSVTVQGAVNVGNLPATQAVSGTVSITAVQRAAALTSASAPGSVPAGATEASFGNVGSSAATVSGGTLPAGCSVTFDAPKGDTLGAIAYDGTGTTLLISTVK